MAQGLLGGLLPAIYSGADQLKRGVYGLLTNPQEQAQRAVQSLLQSRAERQALMGQAFANPDRPFQVTNPQALSQLGTDVLMGELGIAPVGMIAYHGTPHNIVGKFDISKVGTGEGAQSYGHGMYFAEARPVAEEYKDFLGKKITVGGTPIYEANKRIGKTGDSLVDDMIVANLGDIDKAIKMAKEGYQDIISKNPEGGKDFFNAWKKLEQYKNAGQVNTQSTGNLYKVDIPDEYIPKMLDWDKPLLEQTPQVQEALAKLGIKSDKQKLKEFDDSLLESLFSDTSKALPKQPINPTGESIYQTIIQGNPKYTAEKLKEAGITGIRYLDQGSRNVDMPDIAFYEQGVQKMKDIFNINPTEANKFALDDAMQKLESVKRGMKDITSNFVVFDPTDVKILERNDKPVEGLLDFNNPKDFAKIQKTLGKDATEFEVAQKIAQKNAALPLEEGGLGLPKNNTSADRAKAMGFETPVYHGTNADINAFNVEGKGKTSGAGAFVTTNPTAAETYVSASGDGNILPLLMRKEDFLTANARGRNWADIYTNQLGAKSKGKRYTPEELGLDINSATSTDELAMIAKDLGLSGAEIKNVRDLGMNSHVMRAKDYLLEKYGIVPEAGWSNVTGQQFAEAQEAMKKFYESQKADVYALQDPSLLRSRFAAFDPARKGETGILAGMLPFGLLTSEDDK